MNVAPADWLTAADVAGVAGGRVIRVSLPLLLAASELAFRLRLLPFGADRAVLLGGPLALDAGLAHRCLGWKAGLTSSEVLRRALAPPPTRPEPALHNGRW